MFAQVIRGETATEACDELNAVVREELIPALQDEPGFAGALSLFDRRGDAMMIVLWDTEEQARRPWSRCGGRSRQAKTQGQGDEARARSTTARFSRPSRRPHRPADGGAFASSQRFHERGDRRDPCGLDPHG
jgi:hypothetical protein